MTRSLLGVMIGLLAFLMGATVAAAQERRPPGGGFDLPVDCAMGSLCTIQNYIDYDDGEGWLDHTCGSLGYDGHRGIDFRVPTEIEMREGVAVIAAAGGRVLMAFDGQPDVLMQDSGPGKTREERNGNWVAIGHGDGWVTTYAHLLKGSVAVKKGDTVKRGDKLGLIGLSGNSDFPHVHFAVTHRHKLLDPFTGLEPTANCGEFAQSLWSETAQAQVPYRAGGLLSAGFLDHQPGHREVMAGIEAPAQISAAGRTLVFWAGAWGLRKGDVETLQILGPDGRTFFKSTKDLDANKAVRSVFFGRKFENRALPVGQYVGFYRVQRPKDDWARTVLAVRKTVLVR